MSAYVDGGPGGDGHSPAVLSVRQHCSILPQTKEKHKDRYIPRYITLSVSIQGGNNGTHVIVFKIL